MVRTANKPVYPIRLNRRRYLIGGVVLTMMTVCGLGCTDKEREARYAGFRTRFLDVRESMTLSDLKRTVGEPDLRRTVIPGGACSETSGATEALSYELRHPSVREADRGRVEMVFIACLDREQRVVGKSFVEF